MTAAARRHIRDELLKGYADRQADREARRLERKLVRLGVQLSRKREGYRFWVKRKGVTW